MLRPPTIKKLPKGLSKEVIPQDVSHSAKKPSSTTNIIKKIPVLKPIPTMSKPPINLPKPTNQSLPQKVQKLQKQIQKMQNHAGNPDLQQMLMRQIQGIKYQLKQIKQKIGLNSQNRHEYSHLQQEEEPMEIREDIRNINISNSQRRPQSIKIQKIQVAVRKDLLELSKIQPYLKDFKVQNPGQILPYYNGYHKKSSKPVIIKYCAENTSIQPLTNLYQKLWKNIVKAKRICINKVYDINQPLAHNIMVMEANKYGLEGIIESQMKHQNLMVQILRGLQFFHECGYLYRNIRPEHIMMSYEGNIVLVDLKRTKKYIDPRGKLLEVKRGNVGNTLFEKYREQIDEFSSNAQVCSLNEGRKDDLESLGYLALYLLQGSLPWNEENMIKVRPKLTLQQLYGKYPNILSYMISIHKMGCDDAPNYEALAEILIN